MLAFLDILLNVGNKQLFCLSCPVSIGDLVSLTKEGEVFASKLSSPYVGKLVQGRRGVCLLADTDNGATVCGKGCGAEDFARPFLEELTTCCRVYWTSLLTYPSKVCGDKFCPSLNNVFGRCFWHFLSTVGKHRVRLNLAALLVPHKPLELSKGHFFKDAAVLLRVFVLNLLKDFHCNFITPAKLPEAWLTNSS